MSKKKRTQRTKELYLILHNIRSVYNVGSLFRTADAAGVSRIYLSGFTPAPLDRFGKKRSDFHKSALGAEDTVPWETRKHSGSLLKELKRKKVHLIAVEQSLGSQDYKKVKPRYPAALVLGNEVKGLSDAVLKQCDVVAEIPMRGKKESLNVSVAAGIVLFRILNV